MRKLIVTAANSRYFSLLKGLIESTGDEYKFGILDLGLEDYEKKYLLDKGHEIVVPTAIISKPDSRLSVLGYSERPCITEFFPEYDSYLWLDADIWVQDRTAIDDLFQAAESFDVCVIPEIDRNWISDTGIASKTWKNEKLALYYGSGIAGKLSEFPMINSGVLCAKKDSQIWNLWKSCLRLILENNEPDFGVDQVALNYAIYTSQVSVGLFSILYNWVAHIGLPMLNGNTLVEPMPPYNAVKLVHASDNTKYLKQLLGRIEGGTDARYLTYEDFRTHDKKEIV